MQKIGTYLLLGVLVIMLIGYMMSKSENKSSPPQSETTKKQEQGAKWTSDKQDFINTFLASGGEIEFEYKKAYMPPGFWDQIDHNKKEDVSFVIAQYCQEKKYDGIVYVNIYDKMTGKKLAKWSNTTGLTIE